MITQARYLEMRKTYRRRFGFGLLVLLVAGCGAVGAGLALYGASPSLGFFLMFVGAGFTLAAPVAVLQWAEAGFHRFVRETYAAFGVERSASFAASSWPEPGGTLDAFEATVNGQRGWVTAVVPEGSPESAEVRFEALVQAPVVKLPLVGAS